MEGRYCNKRLSSWWKTSSSSTRLLGFIAPLMAVSVMVVLMGSKSSNWILSSNYYPWTWGTPVYPTSRAPHNSTTATAAAMELLPPPAEDGGGGMELRRRVVGGGEREEALSVDYTPERAAAPPVGIQVREAAEPPVRTLCYHLLFFLDFCMGIFLFLPY